MSRYVLNEGTKPEELAMDIYGKSRVLYIFEAAFEYFISLLVTGAYLAKLTSAVGISDTLTGILTAFVSLGCGFQLFAVFFVGKGTVKRFVTVLHSLNQLFFALIYLVPFLTLTSMQKTVLFAVFLMLGHIINNVIYAPKINWFMSLVDNKKRGRFTANKETVSLIGGMLFSLGMGRIIDKFEESGNINGAFVVCGCSVFALMLLHSATLILSREKPVANAEPVKVTRRLAALFENRELGKVILLSVLWNVAHYAAMPFYSSYQIGELGFSMTFVSVLSVAYALVRSLFSKPLGRYADKHSFASMLNICFAVMAIAFGINAFTVPENGSVMYTVYYMLYAVGMAGINSATINLIYDYVGAEERTSALALNGTLSGFAGFFTTLAVSPLVSHIQKNGNTLFGIHIYAQQAVSVIAVLLLICIIIYLNTAVKKTKASGHG